MIQGLCNFLLPIFINSQLKIAIRVLFLLKACEELIVRQATV